MKIKKQYFNKYLFINFIITFLILIKARVGWILYFLFFTLVIFNLIFKKTFKVNKYVIMLLGIYFYGIISLLWSKNLDIGLSYGLVTTVFMVNLYLISILFREKNEINSIFNYIFFLNLFLTFVGAYEVFTGNHLSSSRWFMSTRQIPTTIFYNENDFAAFLVITLPFVIRKLKKSNWMLSKPFFLLISLLNLWLIFVTGSRLALICIFIIVMYYIAVQLFIYNRIPKFLLLIFPLLSILILFFNNVIYNFFILNWEERISQFQYNDLTAYMKRIRLIFTGLKIAFNHYFIGVGLGNSLYFLNKYGINKQLHNFWIEYLVDYGLIPLLIHLIIYIKLFFKNIVKMVRKKEYNLECIVIALIIFAIASNLPSSFLGNIKLMLIYSYILGLAIIL